MIENLQPECISLKGHLRIVAEKQKKIEELEAEIDRLRIESVNRK